MSRRSEPPRSAADELRELITEAHSTIKALRQAERDAKVALRELDEGVRQHVKDHIQQVVNEGLQAYREQLVSVVDRHARDLVEHVTRCANRAMYGNPKGVGVNVFDVMRERLEGDTTIEIFRDIN
jgi:hypothetical protein